MSLLLEVLLVELLNSCLIGALASGRAALKDVDLVACHHQLLVLLEDHGLKLLEVLLN